MENIFTIFFLQNQKQEVPQLKYVNKNASGWNPKLDNHWRLALSHYLPFTVGHTFYFRYIGFHVSTRPPLFQIRPQFFQIRATIISDQATILSDQATIISDQATIISDQATILSDQATIISDQATIISDQATIISD